MYVTICSAPSWPSALRIFGFPSFFPRWFYSYILYFIRGFLRLPLMRALRKPVALLQYGSGFAHLHYHCARYAYDGNLADFQLDRIPLHYGDASLQELLIHHYTGGCSFTLRISCRNQHVLFVQHSYRRIHRNCGYDFVLCFS